MGSTAAAAAAALPVAKHRDEILQLYERHRVLLVIGETGSGKTTQIPKYIYEHLASTHRCGRNDVVAVTQPRRVAAMALAQRVAHETGTVLGQLVGYNVRFDDMTSASTRIKFLTDGMLLRELLSDPTLSRYSTIVLDEAHERTLRTDILFGVVKRIQAARTPALSVVVMSATLNPAKFLAFFPAAHLYRVPGRQFPVRTFYTVEPQQDYLDAAVLAVFQLHMERPPGDILVFLTGQEEIEAVQAILREYAPQCPRPAPGMLVCPIYASLPAAQQMAVFAPTPAGHRKIVLATNIAETSITLPGVRYVVDPGFVKMRVFSPRHGLETLLVRPVSKASARQRCGRAGREAAGECYRLFEEGTFRALEEETPPEILRTNLSNVILVMKASGVDDVAAFDYLDAPSLDALKRGLEELLLLGALGQHGQLTASGRLMADCPLIPMLARSLIESAKLGCAEETIAILSLLSSSSDAALFHAPAEDRDRAGQCKKAFAHTLGDHLMLLNVFKGYVASRGDARWCRDNFLDARALRAASDVRTQLVQFCQKNGLPVASSPDPAAVLRALVAGHFMHCAWRQPDGSLRTAVGRQTVYIHPSSILHGQKPNCVIYHELNLTSRCYLRTVSIVEPVWISEYSRSPGK